MEGGGAAPLETGGVRAGPRCLPNSALQCAVTVALSSSRMHAMASDPAPPRRTRRGSGAVTLHDVAKLAGVAPITASRALNTPEQVSEAVRKKVGDAVARTGYVPNILAGGLASARSRLVAAVVPTIAGPVFLETVQSLTGALAERGYQLMLGQSGYAGNREDALLGAIIGRRPDGIVLTGIMHSAEGRKRLLGRRHPGGRDLGPDADADRHAGRLLPCGCGPRGRAVPARQGSSPAGGRGRQRRARQAAPGRLRARRARPSVSTDVRVVVVPAPTTLRSGRAALAELLRARRRRRRRLLQLRPAGARRHDRGAGARHRRAASGWRSSASATSSSPPTCIRR